MTVRHPTQCAACKHLRPPKGNMPVCDAFPGGIPLSISMWGGDHRQERKGDHGVRFEQADTDRARQAFDDWMFVNAPDEWLEAHRGDQEAGRKEGGDEA
jgi:hypothetical protein